MNGISPSKISDNNRLMNIWEQINVDALYRKSVKNKLYVMRSSTKIPLSTDEFII
jgi:hypothetical protein